MQSCSEDVWQSKCSLAVKQKVQETALWALRGEDEEGGEEVLQVPWAAFSCSPWRASAEAGLSWRTAAHGKEPCWSREKKKGVEERNCYGLTTFLIPLWVLRGEKVDESGKNKCTWAGMRKGAGLCFPPANSFFNWQ